MTTETLKIQVSGGSAMVEYLFHQLEIEGLSLAAGTWKGEMATRT